MKARDPMRRNATPPPGQITHDLEKAVPYLLARTGARLGNAFAKVSKKEGLSLVEWRVCASLYHQPDQTLSQLVVNASMDMSALSRLVDRLIVQGYIARERSDADARAVSLSLTTAGQRIARKLIPFAQQYEQVATSGFTAQEIDLLRAMLARIYENTGKLP
jgi:MarR family transcriptional regulator, organic hydroperoxide resistance regulator